MNQEIIQTADTVASHVAKAIRERGLVPNFEDAYHVCDLFFVQLETRGLLPDSLSLYRRAHYFAKFLVLIECTMSEEEN